MDRTPLQCIALMMSLLSAAQLGCQGERSGEYHPYAAADSSTETAIAAPDPAGAHDSTRPPAVTAPDPAETTGSPNETEPSSEPSAELVPAEDGTVLMASLGVDRATGADRATRPAAAPDSAVTNPDIGSSVTVESRGDAGIDVAGPDPADAGIPGISPPAVTGPREIKLLVPDQTFKVEGPEQALRVSYDDLDLLKVLNMEPVPADAVDHFPSWLSGLNGKRIRIRGFMYPAFQATGLSAFVLARDNQICCFGRNPKIYDLIEVTMREGVTTDYIQGRPFDVVGVFHIRPEADEGELYQLYQIDDAIVIDR